APRNLVTRKPVVHARERLCRQSDDGDGQQGVVFALVPAHRRTERFQVVSSGLVAYLFATYNLRRSPVDILSAVGAGDFYQLLPAPPFEDGFCRVVKELTRTGVLSVALEVAC